MSTINDALTCRRDRTRTWLFVFKGAWRQNKVWFIWKIASRNNDHASFSTNFIKTKLGTDERAVSRHPLAPITSWELVCAFGLATTDKSYRNERICAIVLMPLLPFTLLECQRGLKGLTTSPKCRKAGNLKVCLFAIFSRWKKNIPWHWNDIEQVPKGWFFRMKQERMLSSRSLNEK